jgi:hypothetical protein
MTTLAKLQQKFISGIYKKNAEGAAEFLAQGNISPKAQMEIYWRHSYNALTDVLSQHYPATEVIVGKKFMRAAAREFINHHPQQHGNLEFYGTGFPEFLSGYAPARKLAYLPDVARLERALHESMIADGAGSIDPSAFAVSPEAFAALRLKLHPSVRLVESHFPIHDIWQVAIFGTGDETLDVSKGGGFWRVAKHAGEVKVLPIDEAEFEMLAAIHEAHTLLEAYEAAAAVRADFDLENELKNHIVQGLFHEKRTV